MNYRKILIVANSAKYFEISIDKRANLVYNSKNLVKGGGSLKGRPPFAGRGKLVLSPNIKINGRRKFHLEDLLVKGKEVLK